MSSDLWNERTKQLLRELEEAREPSLTLDQWLHLTHKPNEPMRNALEYTAKLNHAASLTDGRKIWMEVVGPRSYLHIPSPSPNWWSCRMIWYSDDSNNGREVYVWAATEQLVRCAAYVALRLKGMP